MAGYTNFFDGPFFDGPFFDAQTLSIGGGGSHPSQGLPPSVHARGQTPEQKRRSREAFGLVEKVIKEVAVSQVSRLETDKQKQYDELTRELKLRNLAFEARYLETLALEREKLLDIEIGKLLKSRIQEEELSMFLMMVAAASV